MCWTSSSGRDVKSSTQFLSFLGSQINCFGKRINIIPVECIEYAYCIYYDKVNWTYSQPPCIWNVLPWVGRNPSLNPRYNFCLTVVLIPSNPSRISACILYKLRKMNWYKIINTSRPIFNYNFVLSLATELNSKNFELTHSSISSNGQGVKINNQNQSWQDIVPKH